MLTLGSLFAGIGGFELGLERTGGFKTEWQVEIDPFCRRVLAKHWPDVRQWDDVRTFPPDESWKVDAIAGGFPCQDISDSGKKAGINGERSGLWSEFARIIGEIRPRIVIVENVAALLRPKRGMGRVLGDLASIGYDADWSIVSACAMGAPHARERVFIVAHAMQERITSTTAKCIIGKTNKRKTSTAYMPSIPWNDGSLCVPGVLRGVDGLPVGVDEYRIGALGNAVVPQCAEWIGRRLLEAIQGA